MDSSLWDTHEQIYGTYVRLSTKLMRKYIFSLQEMMDSYRTCEDHVKNYWYKKCQFFKHQVIDNILVMQYKASLRDEKWSTLIHMWHLLPDGRENLTFKKPKLLYLLARRHSELDEKKD